jgi:hypothetical protein
MNNDFIEMMTELDISIHDLKLNYIRATLTKCRGNKNEASRILGINRRHLSEMIRRYEWEEFKGWKEEVLIAVTTDIKRALRELQALAENTIPRAVVSAINSSAYHARQALYEAYPGTFIQRVPWVRRQIQYRSAKLKPMAKAHSARWQCFQGHVFTRSMVGLRNRATGRLSACLCLMLRL